jgi:hypothetical protein
MPYMTSSYYPNTYPTMMQTQMTPPPPLPKARIREGTSILPTNQVSFNKYYMIGNLREGVVRLLLIVILIFYDYYSNSYIDIHNNLILNKAYSFGRMDIYFSGSKQFFTV